MFSLFQLPFCVLCFGGANPGHTGNAGQHAGLFLEWDPWIF